jgi:predicted amidohydrolase YtcJ
MSNRQLRDSVAYHNGNIHTLSDSSLAVAEAFIVTPQGTFHGVGMTIQILQIAKVHGMVTYDLRGRVIMPGVHDAHVHLLSAGLCYLSGVRLDGDTTVENSAQRMQEGQCACAYQHAFQDWMVGGTFTIPNSIAHRLNETPNNPIIIQGGAEHSAFLNTAGLIKVGYDVDN